MCGKRTASGSMQFGLDWIGHRVHGLSPLADALSIGSPQCLSPFAIHFYLLPGKACYNVGGGRNGKAERRRYLTGIESYE